MGGFEGRVSGRGGAAGLELVELGGDVPLPVRLGVGLHRTLVVRAGGGGARRGAALLHSVSLHGSAKLADELNEASE